MVFSSLVFLFLYLPLVLLLYYCSPRRFRNALLLLANLLFYGWGEPVFLSVMLFSILSSYGFGLLIQRYRQRERLAKTFVIVSIVTSLALLGFFKYSAFLADIVRAIPLFSSLPAPVIPLPIGISFYIFQTMSYTIDVYRGDTDAQRSAVAYGAYVSLFPQLIAGPIVRYKDVAAQLTERHENAVQFTEGTRLFVSRASQKKSCLANPMGLLWDGLRGKRSTWAGGRLGWQLSPLVYRSILISADIPIWQGALENFLALSLWRILLSLHIQKHFRVLAPLAHLPEHMVSGLRLYSVGRQSPGVKADHPQPFDRLAPDRTLAWGQL